MWFWVDDIIVKDTIDLSDCADALEKCNAHGFFLRLGKNLKHCYANDAFQQLPPLSNPLEEIYCWKFADAEHDWRYPNNLDFTLYRKKDLANIFRNCDYKTPYSLESAFMGHSDMSKRGLCYETSKIVNFPLNIVQTDWPNKTTNTHSPQQLLELFNNGLKIDIKKLHKLANTSAHTADNTLIQFVQRDEFKDEKLIVIITPSYNNKDWWEWNLNSLINQDYHNYYILITDDCSTDGTGQAIENYIKENRLENKVHLTRNKERRGALHNLYYMIHSCPDEAIMVTVDGDDTLPDAEVLSRLNEIYSSQDIWLTYGQFIEYPSGTKGWCTPMPEHIVKNNAFREYPHLPSHLRTFYAWLFKSIKLEDMLDRKGDFYSMTWDYVIMLPMIEMASERHLCIQDQIMYVYNNANSISDHRISRQLQAYIAQIVRAKKRYCRLPEKLEYFTQKSEQKKADLIIFAEDTNPELLNTSIESIRQHVSGLGKVYVLYLHNQNIIQKYKELKTKHSDVIFLEIDERRENFKTILSTLYQTILQNKYVIFALSNNKVEQPIDLATCIQALEETQAYAFSLQLSKENPCKPIPAKLSILEVKPDVCAWNYAVANDIWSCPNSIDMVLYRRNMPTIYHILQDSTYWVWSSTDFLGWWSHQGDLDKIGLCFKSPKIQN